MNIVIRVKCDGKEIASASFSDEETYSIIINSMPKDEHHQKDIALLSIGSAIKTPSGKSRFKRWKNKSIPLNSKITFSIDHIDDQPPTEDPESTYISD